MKQILGAGSRTGFIAACGAAGQDDSLGIHRFYLIQVCLVRVDFAIYIAFSDSSGDQLIVLSAKINDNYQFFFHGCPPVYFSVLYYRVWCRGSQTLLHQFFQFSEGITHFFPFCEQFIQNLPIGLRGIM